MAGSNAWRRLWSQVPSSYCVEDKAYVALVMARETAKKLRPCAITRRPNHHPRLARPRQTPPRANSTRPTSALNRNPAFMG